MRALEVAQVASPFATAAVAVVAILHTGREQDRSRAHDSVEREHEREHERAMSAIDYRRELVDDVNTSLEEANRAVSALVSSILIYGECEQAKVGEVAAALAGVRIAATRTSLRFGPDHAAVALVRKAQEATLQAHSLGHLINVDESRDHAKTRSDAIRASRDLLAATAAYVELVGREIGARTAERER